MNLTVDYANRQLIFNRCGLVDFNSVLTVKSAWQRDNTSTGVVITIKINTPATSMNQQQQQQIGGGIPKERAHATNELMGRFSFKVDFLKYFKEQLQLYCPPDHM
jgi:hypothetical protein